MNVPPCLPSRTRSFAVMFGIGLCLSLAATTSGEEADLDHDGAEIADTDADGPVAPDGPMPEDERDLPEEQETLGSVVETGIPTLPRMRVVVDLSGGSDNPRVGGIAFEQDPELPPDRLAQRRRAMFVVDAPTPNTGARTGTAAGAGGVVVALLKSSAIPESAAERALGLNASQAGELVRVRSYAMPPIHVLVEVQLGRRDEPWPPDAAERLIDAVYAEMVASLDRTHAARLEGWERRRQVIREQIQTAEARLAELSGDLQRLSDLVADSHGLSLGERLLHDLRRQRGSITQEVRTQRARLPPSAEAAGDGESLVQGLRDLLDRRRTQGSELADADRVEAARAEVARLEALLRQAEAASDSRRAVAATNAGLSPSQVTNLRQTLVERERNLADLDRRITALESPEIRPLLARAPGIEDERRRLEQRVSALRGRIEQMLYQDPPPDPITVRRIDG